MSSPSTAPKQGGPSWSHRLEQRYGVRMPRDLADWFDSNSWQSHGGGEFNHAVSPDMLLAESPEVIWPGLMLPDTLPVLGNRYGDWLCLRVGPDDQVTELIHWYHGGGDWIPWGRSLAEAIAFDAVRHRLPGRRQAHAISAEPKRKNQDSDALPRWAAQWLPSQVNMAVTTKGHAPADSDSARLLAQCLVQHGVAETAVRCELVLAALDSDIRRMLTPEIATELEIPWEPDAVSWLFDNALLQQDVRRRLEKHLGHPLDSSQDWTAAAEHAADVCADRQDLGWAFDIAGWAAERQGDIEQARRYYAQGILALAFADQSIRFRTHWFPQACGKFSLWRARQIGIDSETTDPVAVAFLESVGNADASGLRAAAQAFWLATAETAMREGRPEAAYDAFYRSGWDLGVDSMADYRQCLRGLLESASKANQRARASVAQTHYNAFMARFGG